jgi:hypothetical protein
MINLGLDVAEGFGAGRGIEFNFILTGPYAGKWGIYSYIDYNLGEMVSLVA